MMIVIYRYYAEVCLFVTKNLHFLQKKMCTFWTFWISNLRARGSKPEVENTPTCNCQNYILAQRSRLLVGQLGPSYDDGDNENGDVLMMPIRMAMTMVMTIRMMLSTLSEH